MENFSKISFKDHSDVYIPYIMDYLKERKINIKPGSRFAIYKNVLQELAKCESSTEYDAVLGKFGMGLILASLKEIMETYHILNT